MKKIIENFGGLLALSSSSKLVYRWQHLTIDRVSWVGEKVTFYTPFELLFLIIKWNEQKNWKYVECAVVTLVCCCYHFRSHDDDSKDFFRLHFIHFRPSKLFLRRDLCFFLLHFFDVTYNNKVESMLKSHFYISEAEICSFNESLCCWLLIE